MHVVAGGWPIVVTNIPIIYGRAGRDIQSRERTVSMLEISLLIERWPVCICLN